MNLQNLSIKGKLMLITMLTSSAALVLSSASFLIYDLISFRHLLTLDLMTQAQIIGYNSAAAMAFRDEAAAFMRCSRAHLCNVIHQKVPGVPPLPSVRIGRRVLFRRESLEQWLEEVETSAPKRAAR